MVVPTATLQTVAVQGVALELAHIAGSAALAPIVFLHEGLGSVALWRDFPQRVCAATGRAGWVYSRRGYGQSAPALLPLHANYLHLEAWQVLPALLAQCNVKQPVLLGHSDGASIALLHASRLPTTACIAMAPHLFVQDISLHSIRAACAAFAAGPLRSKLAKFHADVDHAFVQWSQVWLSEAFASFNITAECAQITCPLLALQGYDDAYGTMAQMDALMGNFTNENPLWPKEMLHRQLLKIEHCGHAPHTDQPAQVLQAVADFLQPLG